MRVGIRGDCRIDLAQAESFSLGPLSVEPATRLVSLNRDSRVLEPRVMQVLVALAEAGGAVISRDQLVARCWAGRPVGEDAIHRAVSQLRRLLSDLAAGTLWIETISKVGYRLCSARPEDTVPRFRAIAAPIRYLRSPQRAAAPSAAAARGSLSRRSALLAALALAAPGFLMLVPRNAAAGTDPRAVEFLKLGVPLLHTGPMEDVEQAAAYFREAVRTDGNYAEAWAHLAFAYAQLSTATNSRGLEQRARSAASRALALAPGNPNAEAALLMLTPVFGNWSALDRRYRLLLAGHPDNVLLRTRFGFLLSEVGRWREAAALLEALVREVPSVPLAHYRLANAYWCTGRIEDAERVLEAATARWPRHGALWETRFKLLTYTGRPQAALELLGDTATHPPNYVDASSLQARLAVAGAVQSPSPAHIQAAVELTLAMTRRHPADLAANVQHVAALGAADVAFTMLEGYFFARGPWSASARRPDGTWQNRYTSMLFKPPMAALRRDSRFPSLLRQIGLADYLEATGTSANYRSGGPV